MQNVPELQGLVHNDASSPSKLKSVVIFACILNRCERLLTPTSGKPGGLQLKSLTKIANIACLTLLLLSSGFVSASDLYVGSWASGEKEVLQITKNGSVLNAQFVREGLLNNFEKVEFPAKVVDGNLTISFGQGDLSGKYDAVRKILVLGGIKTFEKITENQARSMIALLEKNQ